MGWFGRENELYNFLNVMGCDKDKDGKFCVDGNITSFLGLGEEFVVDDSAVYYVDGKRKMLAAGLEVTGRGKVSVF